MKKFNHISKISVWIVNLLILLIAIGGLYSFYMVFRLTGDGYRPESTEGMVAWRKSSSLNIGRYVLAKVTEYDAEEGFSDFIELSMPYPQLRQIDAVNAEAPFAIKNTSDIPIEPYLSEKQWAPGQYKIMGQDEMVKIRWIFTIMLILSLGFTLFILVVFRKFLLSLSDGEFFTSANYKRLIILSIPPLMIPLFEYIAGKFAIGFFADNFQVINGGINLIIHPDLSPVIFGIIFLLMAGMVYEGTRLKEDQDLTI